MTVSSIPLTNANLLNKFDAGYICFIDESGDEGFKFGSGSSEWFIVSGLVIQKNKLLALENALSDIKQKLNWAVEKHLHWNKLHHIEKNLVCNDLLKLPIKSVSVAVHKPSIVEFEKFSERYRLYYYTCRYLLERVSWIARDTHRIRQENNHKLLTIFSNRAGMSYKELRDYLDLLEKTSTFKDIRIAWDFLDKELVKVYRPNQFAGLQFADAIAGATYNALETINQKATKPNYLANIKPKLYCHQGQYLGYGLKIAPEKKVVEIENNINSYNWFKEYFKR
jgi:hypothetical protein